MAKRTRASSIRKLPHAEAESMLMGGVVDDSVPEHEVRELLREAEADLDDEALGAFLRERVGLYRTLKRTDENEVSIAKEMELLDELLEVISEAQKRLVNLPPTAHALLDEIAWKHRERLFYDVAQGLSTNLEDARRMVILGERELAKLSGAKGAKGKPDRDWFLSDLTEWLEPHFGTAAALYDFVFRLCRLLRVDVPMSAKDDPLELQKIVKRWRARKK